MTKLSPDLDHDHTYTGLMHDHCKLKLCPFRYAAVSSVICISAHLHMYMQLPLSKLWLDMPCEHICMICMRIRTVHVAMDEAFAMHHVDYGQLKKHL